MPLYMATRTIRLGPPSENQVIMSEGQTVELTELELSTARNPFRGAVLAGWLVPEPAVPAVPVRDNFSTQGLSEESDQVWLLEAVEFYERSFQADPMKPGYLIQTTVQQHPMTHEQARKLGSTCGGGTWCRMELLAAEFRKKEPTWQVDLSSAGHLIITFTSPKPKKTYWDYIAQDE